VSFLINGNEAQGRIAIEDMKRELRRSYQRGDGSEDVEYNRARRRRVCRQASMVSLLLRPEPYFRYRRQGNCDVGPFAETMGGHRRLLDHSGELAGRGDLLGQAYPMSNNEIIEVRQIHDLGDYPEDVQKAAEGSESPRVPRRPASRVQQVIGKTRLSRFLPRGRCLCATAEVLLRTSNSWCFTKQSSSNAVVDRFVRGHRQSLLRSQDLWQYRSPHTFLLKRFRCPRA